MPTIVRHPNYPGIAIAYDESTDPFYACIVTEALSRLRSTSVETKILDKIAQARPKFTAPKDPRFAGGANVVIAPPTQRRTYQQRGMKFAEGSAGEYNTWILETTFAPDVEFLPTGGEPTHNSMDQVAACNGSGSVSSIEFTANSMYRQAAFLAVGSISYKDAFCPPFITLGHELIHATHGLAGVKDEIQSEEEARTVGIDKYADEALSENALRLECKLPQRKAY
jgi:hypothetical protein